MLIKVNPAEKWEIQSEAEEMVVSSNDGKDEVNEAELRRQMYERIARGDALAEVEENARREWRWR